MQQTGNNKRISSQIIACPFHVFLFDTSSGVLYLQFTYTETSRALVIVYAD